MYQSTHTGAQVDEAVDKVLASPISMMSNRNLLDNGWFTVNQRGVTTITTGYGADRWILEAGNGSATFSDDGVSISTTSNVQLRQHVPDDWLYKCLGKTVTLSIKVGGTVYSGQLTIPSAAPSVDTNLGTIYLSNVGGADHITLISAWQVTLNRLLFTIRPYNGTVLVQAAKLEIGSVSTLANDAPPNFAEELLKCQRYFVRISGYYSSYKTASTAVPYEFSIPFPVQMRAVPTISNVAYVGSSQASGYDASYSGMLRFYSTSGGFVVASFNASADL